MYNPQENPMAKTVVELKDVSVFQRKNLILHDINLTIERGEFVYRQRKEFLAEDTLWGFTFEEGHGYGRRF